MSFNLAFLSILLLTVALHVSDCMRLVTLTIQRSLKQQYQI